MTRTIKRLAIIVTFGALTDSGVRAKRTPNEAQKPKIPRPQAFAHAIGLSGRQPPTCRLCHAQRVPRLRGPQRNRDEFLFRAGLLETVLPYRALRDRSEDLGRRLAGMGIAPGDRVALLAATHPDFLAMFFGCQYAGAIPVPMPLRPLLAGARPISSRSKASFARRARAWPSARSNSCRWWKRPPPARPDDDRHGRGYL